MVFDGNYQGNRICAANGKDFFFPFWLFKSLLNILICLFSTRQRLNFCIIHQKLADFNGTRNYLFFERNIVYGPKWKHLDFIKLTQNEILNIKKNLEYLE